MKIIHTSDWHLGHQFMGLPRDAEHAHFLAWLMDVLQREAADALLITGDIFDSANPPASAQRAFYAFLGEISRRMPNLDVVVIGGNHDSAARLDAPEPLLAALGRIRVRGALPFLARGVLDTDRLLIPLTDGDEQVAAWVAAMPFIRTVDLPPAKSDGGDPLVEGVAALYADAIAAARRVCAPGQALILTGHCYMTGGALSAMSERKILGGNQHALPARIFGRDFSYAALGHLHKPQEVAPRIRYAGSPIPLSFTEAHYPHQVRFLRFEGPALCEDRAIPVPRHTEVVQLPKDRARPLAQVLACLAELPAGTDATGPPPYLEVRVLIDQPEPGLRRQIEEALAGKSARLLKLSQEYAARNRGDGRCSRTLTALGQIEPEEVFSSRFLHQQHAEPDEQYRAMFLQMLERAQHQ